MLTIACAAVLSAEILDRTVAVVGSKPITASEVDLQLRLEAMFNGSALELTPAARAASLDRMVEQRLIETDMTLAGLQVVDDHELDVAVEHLRRELPSGVPFDAALQRYGLTERDVREFLRKQLRFTRYVQFRFRAGLQASDEEIRAAYLRQFAGDSSAPALEDEKSVLRERILGEKSEAMLDERVRQLRAETRIVLLDPIESGGEVAP